MLFNKKNSALVLFSGGQDSATCLAWALNRYQLVKTIAFNYGQNHLIELKCRKDFKNSILREFPNWANYLRGDYIIDLEILKNITLTELIHNVKIKSSRNNHIPNTFVPGRNVLFITIAAIVAYQIGFNILVTGVCEEDSSGYPDCRDDTIKALQVTLNLSMNSNLIIETPLMKIDKENIWNLAYSLGGNKFIDIIRLNTHTCYKGDRTKLHSWGFGCNKCLACVLRKVGFNKFSKLNKNKK